MRQRNLIKEAAATPVVDIAFHISYKRLYINDKRVDETDKWVHVCNKRLCIYDKRLDETDKWVHVCNKRLYINDKRLNETYEWVHVFNKRVDKTDKRVHILALLNRGMKVENSIYLLLLSARRHLLQRGEPPLPLWLLCVLAYPSGEASYAERLVEKRGVAR